MADDELDSFSYDLQELTDEGSVQQQVLRARWIEVEKDVTRLKEYFK